MQHAPSQFLKVAVVSRFLSEHPKVSRFIANHLAALCPFLPMPGAVIPRTPALRRRASQFVP